ncbi:Glutaredoxin-like protein [Dioscorea alata]|uniref:Glutaredoxin-like protein n=1 Tax=Dioscorea alata TaxID=55571 RepID=A0ACB7VVV3_DIOAL|nr:Glutaredoxin-like protein [Dioscorea alata]
MAAMSSFRPASLAAARVHKRWASRPFSISCSTAGQTSGEPKPLKQNHLVLYTKPGCCLCEGLKEKLQVALSLTGLNPLRSVNLQIRDISGNPEWERLYQYEIPVLARVLPDGTEETLPRLSPRLGVELIQKKIAAALEN